MPCRSTATDSDEENTTNNSEDDICQFGESASKRDLLNTQFGITILVGIPVTFAQQSLSKIGSTSGTCQGAPKLGGEVFGKEFGDVFESYVGDLLQKLENVVLVLRERDLQIAEDDSACDYAVIIDDCVLLVECKAVRFSADLATENAIRGDNSTTKIAHAISQILVTAERITRGSVPGIPDVPENKIIGIVVTLGRIFFANSPEYIERYVHPGLSETLHRTQALGYQPQILSIDALEDMITVLNAESIGIHKLVERKLQDEYSSVGDWDPYLYNKYNNTGVNWSALLPLSVVDDFLETHGLSGDNVLN